MSLMNEYDMIRKLFHQHEQEVDGLGDLIRGMLEISRKERPIDYGIVGLIPPIRILSDWRIRNNISLKATGQEIIGFRLLEKALPQERADMPIRVYHCTFREYDFLVYLSEDKSRVIGILQRERKQSNSN